MGHTLSSTYYELLFACNSMTFGWNMSCLSNHLLVYNSHGPAHHPQLPHIKKREENEWSGVLKGWDGNPLGIRHFHPTPFSPFPSKNTFI
jgi:hypothetical protein